MTNIMHRTCEDCGTVRNAPFCPVCFDPDATVFLRLRHDGIEAVAAVEADDREGIADSVDAIEAGFGIFE